MREDLPLGDERLKRPTQLFRYTFEHFARFGHLRQRDPMPDARENHVIPIEAAAAGDAQVIAARPMIGPNNLVIDLDPLSALPSVESVVASTTVRAQGEVPHVRELLMTYFADVPTSETLRRMTGLRTLFTNHGILTRLDLDALPADQMRELAFVRWRLASFAPLERFTNLVRLRAELHREPLDPIARMHDLRFAVIRGPARGWAQLRECTRLESAAFSEIQMANLKRWNTWTSLRELALTGRGLKSLAGLEANERLEELTLCHMRLDDLATLRDLPRLVSLTLRMPADGIDLESVAQVSGLTSLVIDQSAVTDRDLVHLPSFRPLTPMQSLDELTLMGVVIDDGDFRPLAELPKVRRVRLGQDIGIDVHALRAVRPDLTIDFTPPAPRRTDLEERMGSVTINRPSDDLDQWWIFDNLAGALGSSTNHEAEKKIRSAVKRDNRELASRIEWDTEAGAVGIYAAAEADIRRVADIINSMLVSAE
jgi:hypothetical protein